MVLEMVAQGDHFCVLTLNRKIFVVPAETPMM